MPRVPNVAPAQAQAPPIPDVYLAMAAAQMESEGRFRSDDSIDRELDQRNLKNAIDTKRRIDEIMDGTGSGELLEYPGEPVPDVNGLGRRVKSI